MNQEARQIPPESALAGGGKRKGQHQEDGEQCATSDMRAPANTAATSRKDCAKPSCLDSASIG